MLLQRVPGRRDQRSCCGVFPAASHFSGRMYQLCYIRNFVRLRHDVHFSEEHLFSFKHFIMPDFCVI